MPHLLKAIVAAVFTVVAMTGAGPADAAAPDAGGDPRGIKNSLTENTLAYPDAKGEENLIHFGRFGNFDWYFPCQFESGNWRLDSDLVLSLTYDSPRYQPRRYRLARRDGGITMTEPETGTVTVAKLLEGSHIPYF